MGFDVSSIFAGGVAGIFSGISDIVAKFKVDPTIAANNAEKLAELQLSIQDAQSRATIALQTAQLEVDKAEAQSGDKFTSRWRPFVGWVCGVGLVYTFILQPFLSWGALNFHWVVPPSLDINALMTLLFGMLGLGGMRSFDKLKGTSK